MTLKWMKSALFLPVLATVLLQTHVMASAPDTRFSAEEFLEPIKFLASDELQGRGDGTKELDRAATERQPPKNERLPADKRMSR